MLQWPLRSYQKSHCPLLFLHHLRLVLVVEGLVVVTGLAAAVVVLLVAATQDGARRPRSGNPRDVSPVVERGGGRGFLGPLWPQEALEQGLLSPASRRIKGVGISYTIIQLGRHLVLLASRVAIVPPCKAFTRLSSVPRYIIGSSDIDDSGISSVVVLVSVAEGSALRSSDTQFVLGKR